MNAAHRFCLMLTLAAATAGTAACRNDVNWHAQPVTAGGIQIWAHSVEVTSVRLQFRGRITNNGGVPITLMPGAVTFTSAQGMSAQGVGAHHRERPLEIMPGATANIAIDFDSSGFNLRRQRGGQINWTGAITVNGQPVAVPPTVVGE